MAAVLAGDLADAAATVSIQAPGSPRGAGAQTGVLQLLLGYTLLRTGRTADQALIDNVICDARATSALGELPYPLSVSAYLDTRLGRWAEAYASASEALALARETGGELWRCLALSSLALIEAGQGRETACREHAGEARSLAASLDIECPRDVGDALGLLELGLGRPQQAIAEIEPMIQVPKQAGGEFALRNSLPDLVEAYVRTRDPRGEALAHQLAELGARLAQPTSLWLWLSSETIQSGRCSLSRSCSHGEPSPAQSGWARRRRSRASPLLPLSASASFQEATVSTQIGVPTTSLRNPTLSVSRRWA